MSWVNPDASYAEGRLEEYFSRGFCTVIVNGKQILGQKQGNDLDYYIAGTVLSLVLTLMKTRGETLIKSETFNTTLTDFLHQGE